MPRAYIPRIEGSNSPVPKSRREERFLCCTVCGRSITVMLTPEEMRPTHRCQRVYKAMPFDRDLPASQAPKDKTWSESKERHPRPPTQERRPGIVL